MAALAVPALEALADAALVALRAIGVIGGTAVVGEAVKKKVEEAENAKASPIANTDAGTKKPCQKCPPDAGQMTDVNYHMSDEARAYQARVTGFPPGKEWDFAGMDWDGFRSAACMLEEAKADYDQFLGENGMPRLKFQGKIFLKMKQQAYVKAGVIHENPPAKLTYYFQTPATYKLMRTTFSGLGFVVLYVP